MTGSLLFALLIYPGLLSGLLLSLLVGALLHGALPRPDFAGLRQPPALVLALLALAALALLPWPLGLPLAGGAASLVAAWALSEAAFLLPLLPAWTADEGGRVRAASRELQLGLAGRTILWLAVAGGLTLPADGGLLTLLVRLLLALAATLALAPALGRGPFSAERSITPLPVPAPVVAAPRAAALIAAVAFVWAVPTALLGAPAMLAATLLAVVVLALGLGQLEGRMPRLPLPLALRFCWGRLLPFALAGLILSRVVG